MQAISIVILATLSIASSVSGASYSTAFPNAENPISENSNWINGGTIGLEWTNVRCTPGMAVGTQPGNASGVTVYADSTAVLAGNWGPDQTAQATIAVANASSSPSVYEEVELRLRTKITANSITGYEINCSVSKNKGNYYIQIVRWDGPLGGFTLLESQRGHGVDGDILKATITGSTITAYLNGNQIAQVTDSTFTSGSPGVGFFLQGATGINDNYGFSDFSATDGAVSPTPTPSPTPHGHGKHN